jgi:16S rRNA processing protein RimM
VRGVHGLDGTLRVEVLTDEPEARFGAGSLLYLEGSTAPLVVRDGRPVEDGPGWWLTLDGHPDRTSVEPLRNRYLEADVSLDAVRAAGAALWDEVVGSTVRDLRGRDLGRVVDVYRAGGAEVYTVRGGPLGEFDVPAVRDYVREFAPDRGELVVDVDALELDEPEPRPRKPRRVPRWSRHGAGSASRRVPGPAGAPPPERSDG